jgi:hypothetical protein
MSEVAEWVDGDDPMTWEERDAAQYAQVGQVRSLGDRVRELEAENARLREELAVASSDLRGGTMVALKYSTWLELKAKAGW